jgi:hypothetical protein
MPADPQAQRRQDLYDSIILERDVPDLLGGLTVDQYLAQLQQPSPAPQGSTSPETDFTPPQLSLHGLQ